MDLYFTDTRTVSFQFERDSLVTHQNDDQSAQEVVDIASHLLVVRPVLRLFICAKTIG